MASSTRRRRRGGGDRDWMSDPLAQAYFHWLGGQVREEQTGHQNKTYWDLMQIMHDVEFVMVVANDDNRIVDGLDLRSEFLNEQMLDYPRDYFGFCTIFEVMIALSRRLAFVADDSAEGWAWQLLCNLELDKYYDPLSVRKGAKVHEALHNLVWRNYETDGTGGFFPLTWPERDQTKIELWSQMSAYVLEIHPEY